jgi:hypothetical protein
LEWLNVLSVFIGFYNLENHNKLIFRILTPFLFFRKREKNSIFSPRPLYFYPKKENMKKRDVAQDITEVQTLPP